MADFISHPSRCLFSSSGTNFMCELLSIVERKISLANNSMSAFNKAAGDMMGDAPPCNVCGNITLRNGTCYKCLNCGNSMGCS